MSFAIFAGRLNGVNTQVRKDQTESKLLKNNCYDVPLFIKQTCEIFLLSEREFLPLKNICHREITRGIHEARTTETLIVPPEVWGPLKHPSWKQTLFKLFEMVFEKSSAYYLHAEFLDRKI